MFFWKPREPHLLIARHSLTDGYFACMDWALSWGWHDRNLIALISTCLWSKGSVEPEELAVEVRDEKVIVKDRNDYNLSEGVDNGQYLLQWIRKWCPPGEMQPYTLRDGFKLSLAPWLDRSHELCSHRQQPWDSEPISISSSLPSFFYSPWSWEIHALCGKFGKNK